MTHHHSEGQARALSFFRQGKNFFLSGPGGSGKTTLIRHIYRDCTERGIAIQVAALTGCAAVLLGCKARTVHSFAGIGLGQGTFDEVVERVRKNRRASASWRTIRVLVVDEVSMMSKRLFDLLDHVARVFRKRPNEPFGGIQVVFSGDFFQIRPVGDGKDPDTSAYCFESASWFLTFPRPHHVLLQQIFRQTDPVYTDVLNAIREGKLEQRHIDIMKTRVDKTARPDICPTKLFPTRRQVDLINQQELERLPPEDETTYEMEDHVDGACRKEDAARELEYLRKNVLCEEKLRLRRGAQVMCIVNKDSLCNGSRGVVVGFEEGSRHPVVRFYNGIEAVMHPHAWKSEAMPEVGVSQVPLIVSYACTIHKCQGSTLDVAEVDVGRFVFECGQTYVALSRLKGLDGLFLSDFDPSCVLVDPKVVAFYQDLAQN